jgi:hypothetical protein
MKFITDNKFDSFPQDPTDKLQKTLRATINKCQTIVPQNQIWKYINLNPTPPSIRGLTKLHKQGRPIRPIVK